ncbi:oxygenase MpaB family protein [Kibdelosporangium persicum]|uniref:Histidine kinase n=1 Tax=Kibdelosporangium persicum TaxID=2698649 RepID=A0ABX2F494_9PSEU|nr:oxygenase MpaB family protein [Kibdelosporangium persicum]NRN66154.1 Histidine kinase [Kibdelosporangium persicum]
MLVSRLLDLGDLATAGNLKRGIAHTWAKALNADALPGEQYTGPPGDPGLFGPKSVMWYVHDDPSGVVGGVMGLILGSLHEPTMHGTNKHSVYKDDPLGRLGRTVSFVNTMCWASTPVAEKMAQTVRRMHKHVHGTMPDGRPYDASSSEHLIWTGVTQAYGIIQAHLRYHPHPVSEKEVDRYFAEYAVITEMLGAHDVPKTVADVEAYFTAMRPQLTFSEETADVVGFFTRPFGRNPAAKAGSRLLCKAAFDLLPPWAKRLYRLPDNPIDQMITRRSLRVLFQMLRDSVGDSPIKTQAIERATARPPVLSQTG